MLLKRGVGLLSATDTEIMTQILAAPPEIWSESGDRSSKTIDDDRWVSRIRAMMQMVDGAYSLAILTRDAIYAVRDPLGLRPLSSGQAG